MTETSLCVSLVLEMLSKLKLRPLQRQAMAAGSGNIVLHAPPGAGKTLAYLLPYFSTSPTVCSSGNPALLICVPTRELADQVLLDVHRLRSSKLRVVSATPAAPLPLLAAELRRGCEIIIGTPGRLHALFKSGDLEISKIQTLVLDEADLLLSSEKTAELVRGASGRKIFASATFDPWLRDLVNDLLGSEVSVVGSRCAYQAEDVSGVKHLIGQCSGTGRELQAVIDFYGQEIPRPRPKIIIFCQSKFDVCTLASSRSLQSAFYLHADLSPEARRQILMKFNHLEKSAVLVTTDVAARGLNMPQVGLVVHWAKLPRSEEDYLHRIGRMRSKDGDSCLSLLALISKREIGEARRTLGRQFEPVAPAAFPDEAELRRRTAEKLIADITQDPEAAMPYQLHAERILSLSANPEGTVAAALHLLEQRFMTSLRRVSLLSGLCNLQTVLLYDPLGIKIRSAADAKRECRLAVGHDKSVIGKIALTTRGYVVDVADAVVPKILDNSRFKASRIRTVLLTVLPELVEDSPKRRHALAMRDKKLCEKRRSLKSKFR